MIGLGSRAVLTVDDVMPKSELFDLDFTVAKKIIRKEQERSKKYLARALDVEGK